MEINHEKTLLEALMRKQKALGYTDSQMAGAIGVSAALWCLIKQGKRPMGKLFLRGVLQHFPEFTTETLFVLRGNVTPVTTGGQECNQRSNRDDAPAAS